MNKLTSVENAISLIKDGMTVAIGGNTLHRSPMALVREMIRQGKRNLKLIKTAGAMDVDALCLAGCVASVDAGFISYESMYGLANHYRKAIQSGEVTANEHACYTVMASLRAAATGIPFMPVKGLVNSDLIEANDYFKIIDDPFGGGSITLVKAIIPDFTLLHAHAADEKGNTIVAPPLYDDILMAKASKNVIVSAECIVTEDETKMRKDEVSIPHFMVGTVVSADKGATPGACPPLYDTDDSGVRDFLSIESKAELETWLMNFEASDHVMGEERTTE